MKRHIFRIWMWKQWKFKIFEISWTPEDFRRKVSSIIICKCMWYESERIILFNCIGLKPQLVARLSKALKAEESESICAETQIDSNNDAPEAQLASNSSNEVHDYASNDSMDNMDIDLADIVVIDEYDSTKNESKHESSSKRVIYQFILNFQTNLQIFRTNL